VDNRCKRAEVTVVIKTTTLIGTGTENDPAREVVQYWTPDGKLLATNDPKDNINAMILQARNGDIDSLKQLRDLLCNE